MEIMSGYWTVVIEVICCAMYLRTQRLRFGKTVTRLIMAAALALMLGLQLVYLPFPFSPMGIMLCNILVLKLAPMFLLCLLLSADGLRTAMFLFAEAFTTAELFGAVIQGSVLTLLTRLGWTEGSLRGGAVLIALSLCVLALWLLQRFSGIFGPFRVRTSTALLAFAVSYISFAVSYLYVWNTAEEDAASSGQYLQITVYLSGLLILFLLQYSQRGEELRREMDAMQHVLDLRYQQYQDYVSNTSYLQRQLHDLKHQIVGLRALNSEETTAPLAEGACGSNAEGIHAQNPEETPASHAEGACMSNTEGLNAPNAEEPSVQNRRPRALHSAELDNLLDELEREVKRHETWNVSGNSVLDALLTQQKQACLEKGIQLLCTADGKALDFLPAREICTIFGNLLDNAAEAAGQLPDPDSRLIQIQVGQKGGFLVIRVENRFVVSSASGSGGEGAAGDRPEGSLASGQQGLPKSGDAGRQRLFGAGESIALSEDGLPRTTKANAREHGIGLKSVRYTAQRHGGTLHLSAADGWFVAAVMIPVES